MPSLVKFPTSFNDRRIGLLGLSLQLHEAHLYLGLGVETNREGFAPKTDWNEGSLEVQPPEFGKDGRNPQKPSVVKWGF